ncbi:DUF1187 family protein [Salmonella enterica]
MYKVTAVIEKPGGAPVHWVRYVERRATEAECLKLLGCPCPRRVNKAGAFGRTYHQPITLSHFKCEPAESMAHLSATDG